MRRDANTATIDGERDTMAIEKEKKIRRSRRVDLRCELGFSSDEIEGEAHVTNVSTGGCRAESEINVAEGLQFMVLLHLPGQSPVKIERAAVRWVKGTAFGLSFMLFLPSERAKLQKYLDAVV
ncbi:MAG TPA: PilZ domain-containing protein [Nitrospira sp.]|nr:PilZ domain-containing protein [Nitrospira sp.]